MNISTECAHAGGEHVRSTTDPSVMPIYQTAVYDFPDLQVVDDVYEGRAPGFIYGRFGGPNQSSLEGITAKLEKGEAAVASASGMASITIALLTVAEAGDEVVVANDCYGGTMSLAARDFSRLGIRSRFVPATSLAAIGSAIANRPKVLLVETISNPLWNVVDVEQLAGLCHREGVKLFVDNTVATPFLIRPLTMGADAVIHSATKFLGGHHDVTAGVLVGSAEFVMKARQTSVRIGTSLSPFDAWLAVRGIKTFSLRMERICSNALAVAKHLSAHAKVSSVHFPGLETHPHFEIVQRTMRGLGGGMLSFELKGGINVAHGFIRRLEMIRLAPSLGGLTTTISHPAKTSHRSLTPAERTEAGISDALLRLSVGIEDIEDIIADLDQALAGAANEL